MKYQNQKKIQQLKEKFNKIWNSKEPIAKSSNYTMSLYCESAWCKELYTIMLPHELPNDKELHKMLKERFNPKFARIPLNGFKRTYVYFVCPVCGWEKFTKVSQMVEEKYIDVEICKDCKSDVCLWTKCKLGGYIKNE
jgi:hypothetical protein